MKHLRPVSLLTVWLCLASTAFATVPPSGVEIVPVRGVPVETIPVHHGVHSTGPIVITWHFTKAPGFANLIVNSDGSYLFSGNYKKAAPFTPTQNVTYDFSIMFALKSSLGGMILFQYTGPVNGNLKWSEQGKSATLKDDFKTFAAKHDWSASYRVALTPSGKRNLQAYCSWMVSTFGVGWINSKGQEILGWSPGEYAEWKGDNCGAA